MFQSTSKTKYCYGYVRVSTTKQAAEGVSLDNQKQAINDWAQRNNAKVMMIIVDEGVSGTLKAEQRPGLQKVLAHLKTNNVFITYSVSRMSRNFPDSVRIIELVHERGAYFASVTDNYDTSNIAGQTTVNIMLAISQMQAQQTSQASKEAAEQFKRMGRHNGKVPYGWRKISPERGSGLEENPEQQKIIAMIRDMRSIKDKDGMPKSFNSICNFLNAENIPPPGTGRKWNVNSLIKIHDRVEVNTKGRHDTEKTED